MLSISKNCILNPLRKPDQNQKLDKATAYLRDNNSIFGKFNPITSVKLFDCRNPAHKMFVLTSIYFWK